MGSATLGEVKGEVTVRLPQGQSSPAQRGQVLTAESILETGKGSAVLNLQDGSQVLVKARTRLTLKSPEQANGTFVDLLIGKLVAQVKKRLGTAPSFKLGTPSAVITVRGTRFGVEVTDGKKTIVDVYEGLVNVAGSTMQGQSVLVGPGYWTEVEQNRPPIQPRGQPGGGGRGNNQRSDDGVFRPGMTREPEGSGSSSSSSSEYDDYHHSSPQGGVPAPGTQPQHETEHD